MNGYPPNSMGSMGSMRQPPSSLDLSMGRAPPGPFGSLPMGPPRTPGPMDFSFNPAAPLGVFDSPLLPGFDGAPRQFPLAKEDERLSGAVVHPPRPLRSCPMTEQYGFKGSKHFRRESGINLKMLMKAKPHYGWGQAVLRHKEDFTLFQRLVMDELGTNFEWFFMESKGVVLNFWSPDFIDGMYCNSDHDSVHPFNFIDLRRAYTVDTQDDPTIGVECKYQVIICFAEGQFMFRVKTKPEAEAWKARIFRAIAENTKLLAVAHQMGYENLATGCQTGRVDLQDFFKRLQSSKKQTDALSELMAEARKEVARGTTPNVKIVEQIYHLYTEDEDMDLYEIELLYKDMIEVRSEALRKAIRGNEAAILANHSVHQAAADVVRKAVEEARNLLKFLQARLNPSTFMDEVISLRATVDCTKNGRVTLAEFIRAGPAFLMPVQQLEIEANIFYPERLHTGAMNID